MKLTYRCMFNDHPPSDPVQWQDFDRLLSQYQRVQETRFSYRRWLYGTTLVIGLGLGSWGVVSWFNTPRFANLPVKITSLPPQVSNPENPLQNDRFTSQLQTVPVPEKKTTLAPNAKKQSSNPNKNGSERTAASQFEEAQPIGGYPALYEFFADHLQYPEAARAAEVEGSVLIEFYIDEEGRPNQIRVIQGVNENINQEAIRLVRSMPRWSPAQLNGEPVATKHTMPLSFQLNNEIE